MPFVYFLIALVAMTLPALLIASAVLFLRSHRVPFSGIKPTKRQVRAWRRGRLKLPTTNRRTP